MIIVAAVVFVAAALQGSLGFGFGLVTMSVLPRFLGIDGAVPLVALLGQLINVLLLVQLRRSVRWSHLRAVLLGGLLGTPVGVWMLASAKPRALSVGLGVTLLGWFVLTKARDLRGGAARPPIGEAWGYVAGVAGGVLGGAFNTGGPPMVMYAASRTDWTPDETRALLQAFFACTAAVQLPLLVQSGLLDAEVAWSALTVLPAVAFGLLAGRWIATKLDPNRYRGLLAWAIAGLGVSYLVG
jgi:uncharacterized membrane protein YfcA